MTNVENGVSLHNNKVHSDPWIDETGEGTKMLQQIAKKFTNCATIYPIKTDNTPNIHLVNRFTRQHCLRKRRSKMCVIYTTHRNLTSMDLPVVHNVPQLVEMVKEVKVNVVVKKDGTRSREYQFSRHK